MKRTKPVQFAVWLNSEGYPASLQVGKLYRVINNKKAATEGLMRVVDESGEDLLLMPSAFTY